MQRLNLLVKEEQEDEKEKETPDDKKALNKDNSRRDISKKEAPLKKSGRIQTSYKKSSLKTVKSDKGK